MKFFVLSSFLGLALPTIQSIIDPRYVNHNYIEGKDNLVIGSSNIVIG